MIYLSTGGFNLFSGYETSKLLLQNNITNIELSGGASNTEQIEKLLPLTSSCNFQVHNYFPPPQEPFVFNLASQDEQIYANSFQHAHTAIDLAEKIGSRFYSFHAGFLFDPKVDDLGKQFKKKKLSHRESAKESFVDRVNQISDYAQKKGIMILLENNVISCANMKHFGINPFLMTDHKEAIEIMNSTDDNVGLLTDVAHLKVSSQSEGFCKNEYLDFTGEYTFAYHFSDNDGKSDTNQAVTSDSWFWPFIRRDLTYYSLEVYSQNLEVLAQQIDLAKRMLYS